MTSNQEATNDLCKVKLYYTKITNSDCDCNKILYERGIILTLLSKELLNYLKKQIKIYDNFVHFGKLLCKLADETNFVEEFRSQIVEKNQDDSFEPFFTDADAQYNLYVLNRVVKDR